MNNIINGNSSVNTKQVKIEEMKSIGSFQETKVEYFSQINYCNDRFEFITMTPARWIHLTERKPNKIIHGFIDASLSSYIIINEYKLAINLQADQGYYEHVAGISDDLKYLWIWSDKGYCKFIKISELPKYSETVTETVTVTTPIETKSSDKNSNKFNILGWFQQIPNLFTSNSKQTEKLPEPMPHLKKHRLYRAPMGDTKQFKWFYNSQISNNILCCIMDFGDMESKNHFPQSCPTFTIFDPQTNEKINRIQYAPPVIPFDRYLSPDYGQNCFVDFSLAHLNIIKYWTYYRALFHREHKMFVTYNNHNFNYYCIIKNNWTQQQCIKQRPLADNNKGEIRLLAINDKETVIIQYFKHKNHIKFILNEAAVTDQIDCKNIEQNTKYIPNKFMNGGIWNFEHKLDGKTSEICVALFAKNNNNILLVFTSEAMTAIDTDFRGCQQMYIFMNGSSKQKRTLLMNIIGKIQNGINNFGICICNLLFEYVGWDLVSVFNVKSFMNGMQISEELPYRLMNLPTFYYDGNTNKLCMVSTNVISVIDLENMFGCNDTVLPL